MAKSANDTLNFDVHEFVGCELCKFKAHELIALTVSDVNGAMSVIGFGVADAERLMNLLATQLSRSNSRSAERCKQFIGEGE